MNVSGQVNAFKAILAKEVKRFSRAWVQTLVPPLVATALHLIIFGEIVGERIGLMGGVSYLDFVVPGLVLMTIINNTYANVAASFFSVKFDKSIEALLISPTPNHIILLGFIFGGVARGFFVGIAVMAVSSFFTKIHIHNVTLLTLVFLLTTLIFSVAGVINALFASSFEKISMVQTFVLSPLVYLGGVFFSVELFDDAGQKLVKLNPVFYLVNSFRYAFIGVSDVPVGVALCGLFLILIALMSYANRLLIRGVGLT